MGESRGIHAGVGPVRHHYLLMALLLSIPLSGACTNIYIPEDCWCQPKFPAALPKLVSIVQTLGDLVGRSTRDKEPLVNAWVYGGRSEVLALGDVELVGINTIGRVGDRDVGAVKYVRFCQLM